MTPDRTDWSEVTASGASIAVSMHEPVALIRRPGANDVVVSWPDLDLGLRATSATVLGAPTGAWVLYRPLESEDESVPDGEPAAVHVGVDGEVTRFGDLEGLRTMGTSRHGLWMSPDGSRRAAEETPPRAEQHVVLFSPDGTVQRFTIDRPLLFVLDNGEAAHMLIDELPPKPNRLTSIAPPRTYRAARITDLSQPVIPLAHAWIDYYDDRALMDAVKVLTPRVVDAPRGIPLVRWEMATLTPAQEDAAVRAVLHEFEHLRGLVEPLVEAVGVWPHTRVEVSFRHPHFPDGRLRRILRVFDDAGRAIPSLYASVHLKEDLATKALPDASEAKDGILEI